MATLGGIRSAQQTREVLAGLLEHWERHGFGWWIALDAASGRFAGRGGLRRVEVEGAAEVEVGYGLLPDYWGRGLATELALESVGVAFRELGMRDLVSFALTHNRASQRVMEKAGFHYERHVTYAELPHVLYRRRAPEDGADA